MYRGLRRKRTTLYCGNVHKRRGHIRARLSWAVPQAAVWNVVRPESWKRPHASQTSWPSHSRLKLAMTLTAGQVGKATGLVEWGPKLCYSHGLFGASSPGIYHMASTPREAVAYPKVSSTHSPLSFNPEVRSPGPAKFTGRVKLQAHTTSCNTHTDGMGARTASQRA